VTDHERALLLSVRPKYAESILSGTKRAEIRRRRPAAIPGTPVIIYATKPVAAVLGTARIERIDAGSPGEMWDRYANLMDITRSNYGDYLYDVDTAYVLLLSHVYRLGVPLSLEDMRRTVDFHPPRSYSYMSRPALRTLVNGHASGPSLLALLPNSQVVLDPNQD